jgi:hypothetical protein
MLRNDCMMLSVWDHCFPQLLLVYIVVCLCTAVRRFLNMCFRVVVQYSESTNPCKGGPRSNHPTATRGGALHHHTDSNVCAHTRPWTRPQSQSQFVECALSGGRAARSVHTHSGGAHSRVGRDSGGRRCSERTCSCHHYYAPAEEATVPVTATETGRQSAACVECGVRCCWCRQDSYYQRHQR